MTQDLPIPEEARKAAHDAAVARWLTGSSDTTQMLLSVDAALAAALPRLRFLENATYTAAEVKVLTEAALRLGRKEAGEEIAAALRRRRTEARDEGNRGWPLLTEAAVIALEIGKGGPHD